MKRFVIIGVIFSLLLGLLAACTRDDGGSSTPTLDTASQSVENEQDETGFESASSEAVEQEEPEVESSDSEAQRPVLFIGYFGNYQQIELEAGADSSPDALIAAIAETTGWNLDLAEPVSTGKEGSTVVFAKTSAIFVGPPEDQNENFFVYDLISLQETILDSIWQTLRYNAFIYPDEADLDSYHVYFAAEGDVPITIMDSYTIPIYEPYMGAANYQS